MTDAAIILAGGMGTRLRGTIGDLPKPLAPVQGRPFIAWQLNLLAAQGIRTVVLATGYRAGLFRETLGEAWQGMRLLYSPEPRPLGTGGAIALAARHIEGGDAFVLNGDTYLQLDLRAFMLAMRQQRAWAGLALAQTDDTARYGAVHVEGEHVSGFVEKGRTGAGWINGGVYWLSADALAALPHGAYSFERDILPGWSAQGRLGAFRGTRGFIDIGVPEDYRRIQRSSLAAPCPGD